VATNPAPKAAIRPPTNDAHLAPETSLNVKFVALPDKELIAHLNHHHHTGDFTYIRRV
jgi:hypothetical protein